MTQTTYPFNLNAGQQNTTSGRRSATDEPIVTQTPNGKQNKKSLRIRSASVGRSRDHDLRCRYWGFLFDNLRRAVDEIYQNCEKDESIVECKEAILVLDNYRREFTALIDWLNLNNRYDSTPPPERPVSISWEIRKSMPQQITHWNNFFPKNSENQNSKQKSINNELDNKNEENVNKSTKIENNSENTVNESNDFCPKIISETEAENKTCDKHESDAITTCSTAPAVTTIASKPLNPLARSFTSRIHQVSTSLKATTVSSAPAVTTTTTTTTANKKSTTATDPKPVGKVVTKPTEPLKSVNISTNLKRTVVSSPDLRVINVKTSVKDSKTERRSEPKIIVSLINKNFTKETNSSRAKNVKNIQNSDKLLQKSQNNILSTRTQNKINSNLNSINNNKNKRIVDADGWEMVGRSRQRSKTSPPKVIIVESESLVKTTADGTVIAVTSCSQTTDDWDPMCSSWNSATEADALLRSPGRAHKMHEKLSSPSRKRNASPQESIKRHEEKLAKAQEAREKYLEKKAQKFKGIVKKVEEMKVRKEEQQMQLKASVEMKLQKAEDLRQQQLEAIVRKAHDEHSKVNEILFINSLEAQNKKYDILSKEKDREMRLQDIQDERQRKLEEKQAKEAAVEERRKAQEEKWQQRIAELQEIRKLKDQKIEQQFQEKEKQRIEMANQKALDRQTKLSAINALHVQNIEELQKRIQQKQEESCRRHTENMTLIRHKALELSVRKSSSVGNDEAPVGEPYDFYKLCQLCQVIIKSEVYLFGHLRGKRHNDAICEQNGGKVPTNEELENFNLKYIIEAPIDLDINSYKNCDNEKLKAARKRTKKLRQRLVAKANQFEANSGQKCAIDSKAIQCNNKTKISKLFKDLSTLSSDTRITGQWPTNMTHSLERILTELEKFFRQNCFGSDSYYFQSLNGIQLLTKLLSRILNGNKERPSSLTDRSYQKLAAVYELICGQHLDISDFVLQSNQMIELLAILCHRINLSDSNLISSNTSGAPVYDPVIGALCRLLATIFDTLYSHYSTLVDNTDDSLAFNHIIQDLISYIVNIGMIDKLSIFMSNTWGPMEDSPELSAFLQNIISFFSSISKLMALKVENIFGAKLAEDDTQLMLTLQMTHICGVLSLIYGVLLHSGSLVRTDHNQKCQPLAKHTLDLTLEAIRFLNYVSILDLSMIQCVLGGEGLSLQLRHICSYLLWYCSQHKCQHLLNEVILLIGNFVVLNNENQTLIQSGQRPTVVQQLCSVPFDYFLNGELSDILFPTLIACCLHNRPNHLLMEEEMSSSWLSSFINSTIISLQLRAVNSHRLKKTDPTLPEERLSFAKRFPKNKWNEAKNYFESPIE